MSRSPPSKGLTPAPGGAITPTDEQLAAVLLALKRDTGRSHGESWARCVEHRAFIDGGETVVRHHDPAVDHHVDVVPAGVTVALADLVAEDALARLPETAQPFDVEMDQIARLGVLVAVGIGTRLRRATRDARGTVRSFVYA